MDVLQLNMAHNYKTLNILTYLKEETSRPRDEKGACTDTYTCGHSTSKPTYNHPHHTQAHTHVHTGTHIHG